MRTNPHDSYLSWASHNRVEEISSRPHFLINRLPIWMARIAQSEHFLGWYVIHGPNNLNHWTRSKSVMGPMRSTVWTTKRGATLARIGLVRTSYHDHLLLFGGVKFQGWFIPRIQHRLSKGLEPSTTTLSCRCYHVQALWCRVWITKYGGNV